MSVATTSSLGVQQERLISGLGTQHGSASRASRSGAVKAESRPPGQRHQSAGGCVPFTVPFMQSSESSAACMTANAPDGVSGTIEAVLQD